MLSAQESRAPGIVKIRVLRHFQHFPASAGASTRPFRVADFVDFMDFGEDPKMSKSRGIARSQDFCGIWVKNEQGFDEEGQKVLETTQNQSEPLQITVMQYFGPVSTDSQRQKLFLM